MTFSGKAPRQVQDERNGKGRWVAGISGNPRGRPRKKATQPKGLADLLAEAMSEMIPIVDARGRRKMVPAYEAVAHQLVRSMLEMKPRELTSALKMMQDLQVFGTSRKHAGTEPETLTLEQTRERLHARLAALREQQPNGFAE